MFRKSNGYLVAALLLSVFALGACTQSYSEAQTVPLASPTIEGDGTFPDPIATDDPMGNLYLFATQTASVAQALGTDTTTEITPDPDAATAQPADPNVTETPVPPVQVVPTSPAFSGTRPATYTLQQGEFPYCIARRYDVNPDELLSASGLTKNQSNILYPGFVLTIPQTGNPFPGNRALRIHPTTYIVANANETVYSIACLFGDVFPMDIVSSNGLISPYTLSVGQTLHIP